MRRLVRLSWPLVLVMSSAAVGCTTTATRADSQAESLKDWALCRCLEKASRVPGAADDASKSAAAYLEMGKFAIEVYHRVDSLVDASLEERRSGSVQGEYNTMKCIDLYRGAALDKLVEQALRERR
jgi:hypothetical protein